MAKRKYQDTSHLLTFAEDELDNQEVIANVDRVSGDGRRVLREEDQFFIPPSPERPRTRARHEERSADEYRMDFGAEEVGKEGEEDEEVVQHDLTEYGRRRKNKYFVTTEQDAFLREWTSHRDEFLAELLRHDGLRGDDEEHCRFCSTVEGRCRRADVRCKDCIGSSLMCETCCVTRHLENPLHNIMKWNSRFFEATTLQALGLVVQLGHRSGTACNNPKPGPVDFFIIHTNGFHPVSVLFCQCEEVHLAGTRVQQLLRHELYPATIADPTTCFSFRLLEHFHMLTLQSKISAYDYYRSLQYLTDNVGVRSIKIDRLKAFLRVMREWRHLKMLKRAGRGHEPGGVDATSSGELVVHCPACPRPGFNIPDDWKDVPEEMKFLYTTVVAIDANFRLKRRAVSSEERDPALGSGWGYFVENAPYHAHLLNHADEDDMSSCTGFQALAQRNTRFSAGYASTGVGIALDGRHGFILPNGVGDLQKGERYCNMDYIVASALSLFNHFTPLILSYDIVCQWRIHLVERIAKLPDHLRIELPTETDLRSAIPKYHFNAHKAKDHNQYSLNLLKAGRTDGEEVERNWSHQNPTAGSTREMGPGSRQGTLEDHFGYANWRKYVELVVWLARKRVRCRRDSEDHTDAFLVFKEKVPAAKAQIWIADAIAWERDPSLPDPYYRKITGITEADMRRQLAEEDETAAKGGTVTLHQVTPASMLVELLEIEDQQRKFSLRYPKVNNMDSLSPTQVSERTEKRAILCRRITAIREVQAIYMSCVPQLVARAQLERRNTGSASSLRNGAATSTRNNRAVSSTVTPSATSIISDMPDRPEKDKLFLPYQLSSTELEQCHAGLAALEERLRNAQLHDSLDKLCIQLHVKSRMVTFKTRNVRNQRPNTRIRRQIDVNEQKVNIFAEKYRAARRAKLVLTGKGDWEHEYRELAHTDVRTMVAEDDPVNRKAAEANADGRQGRHRMISEGKRKTSWIWMGAAADDDKADASEQSGLSDALKEEFLRSRARAMRYLEELALLQEDHNRSLIAFEQEAVVWDRREGAARRSGTDPRAQGVAAYAARQAHLRRQLHAKSVILWANTEQNNADTHADTNVRSGLDFPLEIGSDDDEDLGVVGELDEEEED